MLFYMIDCGEIVNDNLVCRWFLHYAFRVITFLQNVFHVFPCQNAS